MALGARSRDVGLVGALAFFLSLMSPVWHGSFGENAAVPLVTVAAGAAIAVFAARQREAAMRARGAAETERHQLELLADAARITDGAADIDEALRRLLELLVPAVADAAWVDVIDPDGTMRRLATRAHGPDRAEIEAWIMGRALDALGGVADDARARGRGRPRGGADRRAARGDDPRRGGPAAHGRVRPALDDRAAAGAERRAARRARHGGRALGAHVRRGRARVRPAARRTRRAGARQRPARVPPDVGSAPAGRDPRLAGRGRDRAGRPRRHRLREPAGGGAPRAARRRGGPHREAGRARRAVRDPPSGRPPGAPRGAPGRARAARARTPRRCSPAACSARPASCTGS